MTKPRISIIVACSKNRGIGKANKLLWRIPEDMKRMKSLTTGHPIIMGFKTFESIGRPLPNRTNIVLALPPLPNIEGAIVAGNLDEALEKGAAAPGGEEIFIFGGGQVYAQMLPRADKIYMTLIDEEADADTFFPDYSMFTKKVFEQKGNFEGTNYTFLELER